MATAFIVDELPMVGDIFILDDREGAQYVDVVAPHPLEHVEQENPEIWNYSVWELRLKSMTYVFVAIHEVESETI